MKPTRAAQVQPTPKKDTEAFSWLLAQDLPNTQDQLIELVDAFFVNIHPLRSFGFIHKPSLLKQFDGCEWSGSWQQDSPDALMLVICALGAKFCALNYCDDSQLADGLALSAGSQWARKAQQLILLSLNKASIGITMATVLLHEHELRMGNYANAFMLTGLSVRMAQALQINLESSSNNLCSGETGPSSMTKEARRRLMWSIYIMDSWVWNGVDELTLLDESDIKIQLPCSDIKFELQQFCIVETLHPGAHLSFLSSGDSMKGKVEKPDLRGHFIRLVSLRRKVLR